MHLSLITKQPRRRTAGFTLLELTVVSGLVAMLFVVGAMVYSTIGRNTGRSVTYQPVTLGKGITNAFFPDPGQRAAFGVGSAEMPADMDVMTAPNYGTDFQVNVMRELLYEDVSKACGVFVLPRGNILIDANSAATDKVEHVNYIHPPTTLDGLGNELPPYLVLDRPSVAIDHPNAFISFLLALYPDSVNNPFPFMDRTSGTPTPAYYRGTPATHLPNASIFIIQPSHRTDALLVRAVWEMDLIRVDNSQGVFASVRRYYGTKLTHFYHVFYSDPVGASALQPADFGPFMACFERAARSVVTESAQANTFKVAQNRPFYFLWWPSPAMASLRSRSSIAAPATTSPLHYYSKHEEQTPLMFTIPLFPSS